MPTVHSPEAPGPRVQSQRLQPPGSSWPQPRASPARPTGSAPCHAAHRVLKRVFSRGHTLQRYMSRGWLNPQMQNHS